MSGTAPTEPAILRQLGAVQANVPHAGRERAEPPRRSAAAEAAALRLEEREAVRRWPPGTHIPTVMLAERLSRRVFPQRRRETSSARFGVRGEARHRALWRADIASTADVVEVAHPELDMGDDWMRGQLAEPAVAGPSTTERGTTRPAATPRIRRGRRLLVAGAVVIALAAIFRLAIVPSLLKLPTNLDVTGEYSGEQFVYVDPATGAPLANPHRLPLEITRHITADEHESDGHRIVLDEAMTASVPGAPPLRQRNRYVMDRRSAVNLGDARSYALAPTNRVNRSAHYRLAFGFDVAEGQPIRLYSNDTDSTYTAVPDPREPAVTVHGNRALVYEARQQPHTLAAGYLAALEQAIGLPATTTLKGLSSGLERAGVDLPAVVAALPRADQERIAQLQGKAIPLIYEESLTSRAAIEPKTGTLANLLNERVTVTVRPDPKALAPLVAILKRNEAIAAVRSSQPKLQAASTHAQPVFALDYHQTPASVSDIGDDISAAAKQLSVAKLWLPLMLVTLGLGLLALGARRARRTA